MHTPLTILFLIIASNNLRRMKKLSYFVFIPLLLIISSCNVIRFNQALQIDENEDWLTSGGNPQKTNISNSKALLTPPFALLWDYNLEAGISKNSISASDGVVFVNSLSGDLQALNISNGKSLGKLDLGDAIFSTPLIYKNYIICTISDNEKFSIVCYNLRAGEILWQKYLDDIQSSPIIINEAIIVSTTGGEIIKLNLTDGKQLWNYRMRDSRFGFFNTPSSYENIILTGGSDGTMYAVNFTDGKELWSFKTKESINSDVSIYNNKIYFGSDDKNLYCLDTAGKLLWKKNLNSKVISSCGFFKENVIVSGVNGYVYSLNANTGEENWSFRTEGTIHASPLIKDDKIFIGSFDFYFYCIGAERGEMLWKYKTEGRIRSSAVIWKEYIMIGCDPKYFYCFK